MTTHSRSVRRGETAEVLLSTGQKVVLGAIAVLTIVYGVAFGVTSLLQAVAALVTLFYLVFVGAKIVVSVAGAGYEPPSLNLPDQHDPNLPTYTILVPMYGEKAAGFAKLQAALARLHYPVAKLQIILALEESDQATQDMVASHALAPHYQVVVVPDCGPTTKPKACDYAMLFVTGERLVIFDFEDRPEPDHLLKAVAGLDYEHNRDHRVVGVQGALQFWNPRGGAANPFYWGEYVVHFRWMLTGMARLGLIPPLGGTSNHFFTSALSEVAAYYGELVVPYQGGVLRMPNVWDAYNVTEDADLAARLRRLGYTIKMVDAVTFEEAPNSLKKARRQKGRWIKGYGQTALVQSRKPITSMREMGVMQYLMFNLFVGGTPVSLVINPIVWSTTALYIVSRVAGWTGVSLYIERLYPGPVYYVAMAVAVFGNAFLLYQKLVTPLRQQEHEAFQHLPVGVQQQQFGLAKYLLLSPLWWVFTTLPAYRGVFELVVPRWRHYWNKTEHGHAVDQEDRILGVAAPVAAPALTVGAPTIWPPDVVEGTIVRDNRVHE